MKANLNTGLFRILNVAIALSVTLLLHSCSGAISEKAKAESVAIGTTTGIASGSTSPLIENEVEMQAQVQPTFSLALVDDHSKSYDKEIEQLSRELLDPVNRFFNQRPGSEQFLFSTVEANSNVLLSRFTSIAYKLDSEVTSVSKNSWISSEQPKPKYTVKDVNRAIASRNDEAWQRFCSDVIGRTSDSLAKKSDVANAINRALLGLGEQPYAQIKVLIIASDLEDDFNKNFTTPIPCDVRIIVVGARINTPIATILGTTNYQRFESLTAALNSLSLIK